MKKEEELKHTKFKINDFIYDERNQPIFDKPQNVVDQILNQLNPLLNKEYNEDEIKGFLNYAKNLATSINPYFIKDILLMSVIRENESEDIATIKFIARLKNLLLDEKIEEIELNNKELKLLEEMLVKLKVKTHIKYQLLKCFELID